MRNHVVEVDLKNRQFIEMSLALKGKISKARERIDDCDRYLSGHDGDVTAAGIGRFATLFDPNSGEVELIVADTVDMAKELHTVSLSISPIYQQQAESIIQQVHQLQGDAKDRLAKLRTLESELVPLEDQAERINSLLIHCTETLKNADGSEESLLSLMVG